MVVDEETHILAVADDAILDCRRRSPPANTYCSTNWMQKETKAIIW